MIREDYTHNATKQSACDHLVDDEEFVRRLVQETLNEVLESEMTEFLGAGKIDLRVPQERSGQFSTQWHSD